MKGNPIKANNDFEIKQMIDEGYKTKIDKKEGNLSENQEKL